MSTKPTSIVSNLNRAEYAALAKAYSATRLPQIIVYVIFSLLSMWSPTLLFACWIAYWSYRMPPGPTSVVVTNVLVSHMLPIFVAIQVLNVVTSSARLWSILSRKRTQLHALFPDRHRREAMITQIAFYGTVQSSAGSSIITPWGNVVRIDETPEAFVLQTRNVNQGGWPAWTDLVYIPKPPDRSIASEISIELLKQFRDASATSPNYLWHADLVSSSGKPVVAETVWPPAPDRPEPNVDIAIPRTGNIYLPMLQATCEGDKLSLKNGPVLRVNQAIGSIVFPFIFFGNFYPLLSGSQLNWGIAGVLAVSAALSVAVWYSKPLIAIDRQKSLVTIKGARFAAASEIQAITVIDVPAIFIFRPTRKPAYITLSKTNGKSRRLPILSYSSSYETNIVAMILGQFLTQAKYPPQS